VLLQELKSACQALSTLRQTTGSQVAPDRRGARTASEEATSTSPGFRLLQPIVH
jgi:hypothetical protein